MPEHAPAVPSAGPPDSSRPAHLWPAPDRARHPRTAPALTALAAGIGQAGVRSVWDSTWLAWAQAPADPAGAVAALADLPAAAGPVGTLATWWFPGRTGGFYPAGGAWRAPRRRGAPPRTALAGQMLAASVLRAALSAARPRPRAALLEQSRDLVAALAGHVHAVLATRAVPAGQPGAGLVVSVHPWETLVPAAAWLDGPTRRAVAGHGPVRVPRQAAAVHGVDAGTLRDWVGLLHLLRADWSATAHPFTPDGRVRVPFAVVDPGTNAVLARAVADLAAIVEMYQQASLTPPQLPDLTCDLSGDPADAPVGAGQRTGTCPGPGAWRERWAQLCTALAALDGGAGLLDGVDVVAGQQVPVEAASAAVGGWALAGTGPAAAGANAAGDLPVDSPDDVPGERPAGPCGVASDGPARLAGVCAGVVDTVGDWLIGAVCLPSADPAGLDFDPALAGRGAGDPVLAVLLASCVAGLPGGATLAADVLERAGSALRLAGPAGSVHPFTGAPLAAPTQSAQAVAAVLAPAADA